LKENFSLLKSFQGENPTDKAREIMSENTTNKAREIMSENTTNEKIES